MALRIRFRLACLAGGRVGLKQKKKDVKSIDNLVVSKFNKRFSVDAGECHDISYKDILTIKLASTVDYQLCKAEKV